MAVPILMVSVMAAAAEKIVRASGPGAPVVSQMAGDSGVFEFFDAVHDGSGVAGNVNDAYVFFSHYGLLDLSGSGDILVVVGRAAVVLS